MYTNTDIQDLCKMGYSSTYKDVNQCALEIINNMRDINSYGVNILSTERVNDGSPDEYTVIKIDVPSKSYIVVDGVEMSGMELAKWYKEYIRKFIMIAVRISDITTGQNMVEELNLTEENIDEFFKGLYRVKAKVRDEEWTEEKSKERVKVFDEELNKMIQNVKQEEEEFTEV